MWREKPILKSPSLNCQCTLITPHSGIAGKHLGVVCVPYLYRGLYFGEP